MYNVEWHVPNLIGGVVVSVIALSLVGGGVEPRWCQTKDYEIGIRCFSTNHVSLRSKNKDRQARNRDDVSKWSDMSIRGLLLQ